jgi:DNA processing protein
MMSSTKEQAAVLALTRATTGPWHHISGAIQATGSALRLLDRDFTLLNESQRTPIADLLTRLRPEDLSQAEELIETTLAQGVHLLTVLDKGYPANLHLTYNFPPFVWVRGSFLARDRRAVAVVGSRHPTNAALAQTRHLIDGLIEADFTIVSGLSPGIDVAAHTAALAAGGRTIAVLAHGINAPFHPLENATLAKQTAESGALVSPYWPSTPPTAEAFSLCKVVTSGLAAATLLIEASEDSAAAAQTRIALDHGKHLLVPHRLHQEQTWVRQCAYRGGVTVVHGLDDILDMMVKLVDVPRQTLTF